MYLAGYCDYRMSAMAVLEGGKLSDLCENGEAFTRIRNEKALKTSKIRTDSIRPAIPSR